MIHQQFPIFAYDQLTIFNFLKNKIKIGTRMNINIEIHKNVGHNIYASLAMG
jgi:hypothetical protein